MKLGRHDTRSVFDRYNITTGDDLRAAAAKLDAAVAGRRFGQSDRDFRW
jgi:hypothetical protein